MKLCKDCKWCVPKPMGFFSDISEFEYARCSRTVNPVDGSPKDFCDLERKYDCKDGKFWEEK